MVHFDKQLQIKKNKNKKQIMKLKHSFCTVLLLLLRLRFILTEVMHFMWCTWYKSKLTFIRPQGGHSERYDSVVERLRDTIKHQHPRQQINLQSHKMFLHPTHLFYFFYASGRVAVRFRVVLNPRLNPRFTGQSLRTRTQTSWENI